MPDTQLARPAPTIPGLDQGGSETSSSGRACRIADSLAAEIRNGTWDPDTVVTRRAAMDRFGCSEHVIAKAVDLLRRRGLVEVRNSVGMRPKTEGRSWAPSDGGSRTEHIRAVLRERIASGTYCRGQRLPTQRALGREFGVTSTVVGDALMPLKEDGVIQSVTRPTRGFVVIRPPASARPAADSPGLRSTSGRSGGTDRA